MATAASTSTSFPRRRLVAAAGSMGALALLGAVLGAAVSGASPARGHAADRGVHGRGHRGRVALPPVTLPPVQPPVGLGRIFGVVTAFTPATAAADGSLSLLEADGTPLTVTTTSSTRFVSIGSWPGGPPSPEAPGTAGSQAAVSRGRTATLPTAVVLVGDDVSVVPATGNAGGGTLPPATSGSTPAPVVAGLVVVEQPELSGTVVSVSGSTLVVSDAQLFRRTVDLQPNAGITEGGHSVTSQALSPGTEIVAAGTLDPSETVLDATSVRILVQGLLGTVGTVSGATFTVATTSSVAPVAVTTTTSTTYYAGGAAATIAAVVPEARVLVLGTRQVGGGFSASSVTVLADLPSPVAVAGAGGRGRHEGAGATGASGATGATGATSGGGHHHGGPLGGGTVSAAS